MCVRVTEYRGWDIFANDYLLEILTGLIHFIVHGVQIILKLELLREICINKTEEDLMKKSLKDTERTRQKRNHE